MSQITMTIVDAQRAIHGQPHGSFVDVVVAALSADPESIEELTAAMKRFVEPGDHGVFAGFYPGARDEAYDAGLCVINLAERLVVVESTYSRPGSTGDVALRRTDSQEDYLIPYHLADEWKFSSSYDGWECRVELPKDTQQEKRFDAREVLYQKVCPFIVGECLAARELSGTSDGADNWTPPEEWSWRGLPERAQSNKLLAACDGVAEIHARWLMTPRNDLDGQSPRELLLAKKEHIGWDLQDRSGQWSMTGECPSGLSTQSAAYRFAGFGTNEIVLYYDLVRDLIWDCWSRIVEPQSGDVPSSLNRADETMRLNRIKDEMLAKPDTEELHGFTQTYVIERERMRLPLAASGKEAMIDDDCPICQMMGDDLGPMFWGFDGSNMDDDFAFSFHATREAWQAEQREWEDFNRRFKEEEEQRRASGETASVWQSSFSNPDHDDESPSVRIFGIGAHLAEIIGDLKESKESTDEVETLNRQFANLRGALGDPNAALVGPVVARFSDELDQVSARHANLADKCASLQETLESFHACVEGGFDRDDDLPF